MASSRLVFDVRLSSCRFAAFVALNVITSDFPRISCGGCQAGGRLGDGVEVFGSDSDDSAGTSSKEHVCTVCRTRRTKG